MLSARRWLAVLILVVFCAGFVGPLAAPSLSLNPSSGFPGDKIGYSASGFTASQSASLYWDSDFLATIEILKDGTSSGSFNVPGGAAMGKHSVSVQAKNGETAGASFTVNAKPTSTFTPPVIPAPLIKLFSLDSAIINPGECTLIHWVTENAVQVTLTADTGARVVPAIGDDKVCPSQTFTYELRADGQKGASPAYVTAKVTLTVRGITPGITRTITPTIRPSITPGIIAPPIQIIPGGVLRRSGSVPSISHIPYTPLCNLRNEAGADTINFDDQSSGTWVTNQYRLVQFVNATARVPSVTAHSGAMALASNHNLPLQMTFSNPQRAVGVYVGREQPSPQSAEGTMAVLTAYEQTASGAAQQLAEDWVYLPNHAINLQLCLEVRAPAGHTITYVSLDYVDGLNRPLFDYRWMDDLVFIPDRTVAPVDAPPQVRILLPASNAQVTTDSLPAVVQVDEDHGLSALRYSINGGPLLDWAGFYLLTAVPPVYEAQMTLRQSQLSTTQTAQTLRVVATDSANHTGEATVNFNYTPTARLDMRVAAIEVVQVVQNMFDPRAANNSVLIFSNKLTMARVFINIATPGWLPRVNGALCLGETGEGGCANPIRSIAPVQLSYIHQPESHPVPSVLMGQQLDNKDATLNFILPMEWVNRPAGTRLTLTAYVNYNREDVRTEPNYSNNFARQSVTLTQPKQLNVFFVPINVSGLTGDYSARWAIAAGMNAFYPIDRLILWQGPTGTQPLTGTWNLAEPHTPGRCSDPWGDLLDDLDDYRDDFDNPIWNIYYQGILNPSVPRGNTGGCGGIYGYTSTITAGTDQRNNTIISAHELGHNLGRQHTPNGAVGEYDENYPVANAVLDGNGVDVLRSTTIYTPGTSHDFMSYGSNRWMSVYNYHVIYALMNSNYLRFRSDWALAGHLAQAAPPAGPQVYLTGKVKLTPTQAQVSDPLIKLTRNNPLEDGLPPGHYLLELQDATGKTLLSRNLGPKQLDANDPLDDSGQVHFAVPYMEGTRTVVFKYQDKEIGRVKASASAPQVTLTSPNGGEQWAASGKQVLNWSASDADKDALTFVLQYSTDGGTTWAGLGRTTAYSLEIDLVNLAGSNQALVRITASDGFNSAEDVSNTVFSVAPKGPEIYMSSPAAGSEVYTEAPVTLQAMGIDPEDGNLSGKSFTWRSDRDGDLGAGDLLVVYKLSAGEHVITLTGTDAQGNAATQQAKIKVNPRPQPLPEPGGEAVPLPAIPGSLTPIAPTSTPAAQTDSTIWFVLGGIIIVLLAVIAGLLFARRR